MLIYYAFKIFISPRSSFFFPFRLKSLLPLAFKTFLALFFNIGFSSYAFGAQLRLPWDANTESDLAGYKVYPGTSCGTYGNSIDVGNVTTYTLAGLTPGQTHLIAIKPRETSDNESGYSNEVSGQPQTQSQRRPLPRVGRVARLRSMAQPTTRPEPY